MEVGTSSYARWGRSSDIVGSSGKLGYPRFVGHQPTHAVAVAADWIKVVG